MDVLFLLVIIVVVALLGTKLSFKKKDICKLHKWVYKKIDTNEYMVCEVCKLLPSGMTEEGN